MAQNHIIKAFRKRAQGRGYEDIHITKTRIMDDGGNSKIAYFVQAVEPLTKTVVSGVFDLYVLSARFR